MSGKKKKSKLLTQPTSETKLSLGRKEAKRIADSVSCECEDGCCCGSDSDELSPWGYESSSTCTCEIIDNKMDVNVLIQEGKLIKERIRISGEELSKRADALREMVKPINSALVEFGIEPRSPLMPPYTRRLTPIEKTCPMFVNDPTPYNYRPSNDCDDCCVIENSFTTGRLRYINQSACSRLRLCRETLLAIRRPIQNQLNHLCVYPMM